MKFRKRALFILIPSLLLTLFLLGPTVPTTAVMSDPVNLPDTGIDAWIAGREAVVKPAVVPGTEKKIFWAGKPEVRTAYSVIYIHGFTGSRQELVPVCDNVAKAIGANIFYTRLKGHGQGPDGFKGVILQDWAGDTSEAYDIGKKIGERIIIISLSTGGPLSLWLAEKKPDIAALVFLSPNLGPLDTNSELILWPWGNLAVKLLVGDYREYKPENELAAKYFTPRHHSDSLFPMMSSVALGRNVRSDLLKMPSLFVYSEEDETVQPPRIRELFEKTGSPVKRLVRLENADHVLAGDIHAPQNNNRLTEIILRFLLDEAGIKPQ